MRGLILCAALALSACVGGGGTPGGWRDPAAPISSMAAFDAARFQGRWYEVAGFHEGACAVGAVTFTLQRSGAVYVTEGPCAETRARQYLATVEGARLIPTSGAPLWVLWVDEGYRTAVIGTPSGAFGYVLNRGRAMPADRMEAARRILDFNGYDTARLRPSAR